MRIYKFLLTLSLTLVVVKSSPKFGERIKKDDNNSSLIEVFRPSNTNTSPTKVSPPKPATDHQNSPKTVRENNDNKNMKHFEKERHVDYKFSTFQQKDNNNDNKNNQQIVSKQPNVEHRSGTQPAPASAPAPAPDPHRHPPTPQEIQEQLRRHFPGVPDFSSFVFNFDVPEVSSSDRIHGRPLPPPPPKAPHPSRPTHFAPGFQHQEEPNYDQEMDDQSFFESAPNQSADEDFNFNAPNGYPHPKQDPRADFKKEQIGAQNNAGKPWGTKTSYTYRDPKNPNNVMEMSEVTMTMNREMDPQEAQSQVQHFLALAQSGQYGPFHSVPIRNEESDDYDRHPNHNYDSEPSHIAEPPEPNEPNFPKF